MKLIKKICSSKKFLSLLALMTIGISAFAYSDLSFKTFPTFVMEDYGIKGTEYGSATQSIEFSISNYNFLDENNRYGIFEQLALGASGDGYFSFTIGGCAAIDVNEAIRLHSGLGLNYIYSTTDTAVEIVDDSSSNSDRTRNCFGFTADFGLKITPKRLFSPVVGVSFLYDPICVSMNVNDGKISHDKFDYYGRFCFAPYVNFCINFDR